MISMTAYDKILAALTVWREARSESMAARIAVLHVIFNRVSQSPKNGWPKTVHGVCVQPRQFSSFNKGTDASVSWPLEKNSADWAAWEEIQLLMDLPMLADPTQGANFYHDKSISPPYLAWLGMGSTLQQLMGKHTVDIGALSFYAL